MNECAHHDVVTKTVPIEMYDEEGQVKYRIGGALWKTCRGCGASFYDPEGFLRQPIEPIAQPQPAQQDTWDF